MFSSPFFYPRITPSLHAPIYTPMSTAGSATASEGREAEIVMDYSDGPLLIHDVPREPSNARLEQTLLIGLQVLNRQKEVVLRGGDTARGLEEQESDAAKDESKPKKLSSIGSLLSPSLSPAQWKKEYMRIYRQRKKQERLQNPVPKTVKRQRLPLVESHLEKNCKYELQRGATAFRVGVISNACMQSRSG